VILYNVSIDVHESLHQCVVLYAVQYATCTETFHVRPSFFVFVPSVPVPTFRGSVIGLGVQGGGV
jgi:hypothetical protein